MCYYLQSNEFAQSGVAGAGVDTDFILYLSAIATGRCHHGAIAYAAACQAERDLDRYHVFLFLIGDLLRVAYLNARHLFRYI